LPAKGPRRHQCQVQLLSSAYPAKRLSTAFDSVTLYGFDPDRRPDIYGKIGTSGVSICTLDDVKVLYGGFDLCAPNTSVSMTINGPAPMMLAMFMNTAIAQQTDQFVPKNRGGSPMKKRRKRSGPMPCPMSGARSRPIFSKKTRARTPVSSPLNSP
jgi:methylmalonyl-CoA mutase